MMKKFTTALLTITTLAVAALVGIHTQDVRATSVPTVGILQQLEHPALDQIHKGVIKGLAEEGYKGNKVKIHFQNAQGDQSNIKTMSDRFESQHVDLTVGIATAAAQGLASAANGQHPVILAGITDPVGSKLVKSDQHPGANITGTSGDSPISQHLKLIKEIVPHSKQIGIIYTTSDHGGTFNAKRMAAQCKQEGLKYKLYAISNTNDMQQVASKMASECDVIYAPQDNGVAAAMKTLVNTANNEKVPVIPAADTMVKDGGVAAYAVSQFKLGEEAGKMAGKVLKGKKTATYPVKMVTKGHYVINRSEAKKLGLKLPAKIVNGAKKNGEVF
ncbi:tryptophan ABC transporter substrate-binding protein [Lacticaseibacillus thailandensis]|nr:tryptophan ABC transporter substrate-binding protein [Lacticaseibacillus thailandensis]